MKFIIRRVVSHVRGRLFMGAAGRVVYNFCSICTLYWPSYYKATYLPRGIFTFLAFLCCYGLETIFSTDILV